MCEIDGNVAARQIISCIRKNWVLTKHFSIVKSTIFTQAKSLHYLHIVWLDTLCGLIRQFFMDWQILTPEKIISISANVMV